MLIRSSELSSSGTDRNSRIENADSNKESPKDFGKSEDVPKPGVPWIRYRTEVRHRVTGNLILRNDSETPQGRELENRHDVPIFELITRYEVGESDTEHTQGGAQDSPANQALTSAPTFVLKIYSSAIINALRSVVQYYPSQDLSGTSIEIKWPYAILVHHYGALHAFQEHCKKSDSKMLCVREKDAATHLTHLFRFMDDNIMERVRAEQERLKQGFFTFENLWVRYKPGTSIVFSSLHSGMSACVISGVSGGIYQNPSTGWLIKTWSLAFDGRYLGRKEKEIRYLPFDGQVRLSQHEIFISDRERMEGEAVEQVISYGRMYYNLLTKQCRHHKGRSLVFPYTEVSLNLLFHGPRGVEWTFDSTYI